MHRIYHIILLLLIIFSDLPAQIYNFRNFTFDDGLTHSEISAICEGPDGNLWIGTLGDGLLRYDGHVFTSYTEANGLANNFIRSLLIDKNGLMWIGTESGVCIYDGRNFKPFKLVKDLEKVIVTALFQDSDDNYWIGTSQDGLYMWDGHIFKHFTKENHLADNTIYCILEGPDSAIWFGTNRGIEKYKNNNVVNLGQHDGFTTDIVRGMCKDKEGNIWLATYHNGVFKFNGDSLVAFTIEEGLCSQRVFSAYCDDRGNTWFGTDRGISKYDGKVFRSFNESNGLTSNVVVSITEDSSGSLWFGTSGGGMSRLDSERFIYFPENDKMGRRIFSLIQATNNNMIFGSSIGGITVFDGEQYSLVKETRGFTLSKVQALYYSPDSALWIGTLDDGVFMFDKRGFKHYTYSEGLTGVNISDFATDTAGNMWISTLDSGVFMLSSDTSTFRCFNTTSGFNSNKVYSLLADSAGSIWFGTEGNGLYKINPGIKPLSAPVIVQFNTQNGLSNNTIRSIITDSLGILYIGTAGGGINIIADTSVIIINHKGGLSSDNIYSLIFDTENRLWVGTEKGVDRLTLATDHTVISCIHFGKNEGFKGIDNYRNACCTDKQGNIWFGTVNGVVKYNLKEDKPLEFLPRTHLTGVKLFFATIENSPFADSLSSWFGIPNTLSLPYKQNHLTFEFNGTYLRNPDGVRYKWMLEGLDKDWSPAVDLHEVTYSNLPPGEYKFMVLSGNEYNQWNPEPVSFYFVIFPPLWQRTWFRVAIALLFIIIIWQLIQFRFHQIKVKNRIAQERLEMEKNIIELEQEASRLQMNPHFIFNSLNSIQGFIATNEPFQAKRYLAKFARLMRLILENAREEFIPLQNEIDLLVNYLELEKLRTNDKFDFSISVAETIDTDSAEIPPMMIQPFVENAIVHGIINKEGHGKIEINFRKTEDSLICEVKDNGIGRREAARKESKPLKHKSTAISVTKKRLEQLSLLIDKEANIAIDDLISDGKCSGTIVTIRIPFETS